MFSASYESERVVSIAGREEWCLGAVLASTREVQFRGMKD